MPPDIHASAHDSWMQLALWPAKPAVIHEVLQDYRIHKSNTSDFKLTRSPEEEKALEARAVQDNFVRLKSFSKNPRLAVWKRLLFLCVYIIKRGRLLYRHARSNVL
jgi:hypothetical protein